MDISKGENHIESQKDKINPIALSKDKLTDLIREIEHNNLRIKSVFNILDNLLYGFDGSEKNKKTIERDCRTWMKKCRCCHLMLYWQGSLNLQKPTR